MQGDAGTRAKGGKKRILFVCKGNMCRSPMAEAVANARWGEFVHAESAGLSAWAGDRPTDEAILMARRHCSYDLGKHRARHIDEFDLAGFDFVVGLTEPITAAIRGRVKGGKPAVVALEIADPYLESAAVYERTLKEIERQMQDKLLPLVQGKKS